MKSIVFIGTSKTGSSNEAIKAADMMHYYTVLLTNQESFMDRRTDFPHIHLMKLCNISKMNAIIEVIDGLAEEHLDIAAIVSFVDPYTHTAALVAEEYGLKSFSADAIAAMQDKIESRHILDGSPFIPYFNTIDRDSDFDKEMIEDKLPLVLKVPTSAGSRDVYKVQTYRQYKETALDIRTKYPDEPILVEEFLDGPQYLVETVTINNKVTIVAIIEQEITFVGKFIVTGYRVIMDHENEFYQSLKRTVNYILCMHGMENGPAHLELRYDKSFWKLIEANPRIAGGAMNLIIETAYGISLVKETLKISLGLEPDFNYKYKKETFAQYVIVPKEGILVKVTGKHKALNSQGVKHVYLRPHKGSLIVPPISMGYRYAYVIANGNTADEARENAKFGASQIKFYLQEIDADSLEQLSNNQRVLLDIVHKSEPNLDNADYFYNNFIMQSKPVK